MPGLTYGNCRSDEVEVAAAFGRSVPFLLGRTAATDPRFPKNLAGSTVGLVTGAACGIEPDVVRLKAFAELVEHVSGFLAAFEPGGMLRSSLHTLRENGFSVVAPSSLQHFADWQHLPPQIDRAPDTAVRTYCRATRLTTGERVYVPANVAFLLWEAPAEESCFLRPCATGTAAGLDAEAAICRALLEVIERDACMISWRIGGYPLRCLDEGLIPRPLQDTCRALGLQATLYCIENEGLPPTVLALLARQDGSQLTCGSACGALDEALIGKAVGEALMLQWSMRHFREQFGVKPGSRPCNSLQHVAAAFQTGPRVREWYRRQTTCERIEDLDGEVPDIQTLAQAAERFYGSDVLAVDLTDPVAKASGWHVARVIIPGALPREADGRIPHLGGRRLERVLEQMGRARHDIHTEPHPFG